MIAFDTHPLLTTPHGFFTRTGGISTGLYSSLNGGIGSKDKPSAITTNHQRIATTLLPATATRLHLCQQTHSAICHTVDETTPPQPQTGDALATRSRGILLAVQTADCAPILLYDSRAGVCAACHAGWKGALGGVIEATISTMQQLGATPAHTIAIIGACIQPQSYEVDGLFLQTFLAQSAAYQTFFTETNSPMKFHFDLPRFVRFRLYNAGIATVEDLARDTVKEEAHFFSFRRATQRGETDYGRQLSVIGLA